MKQLRSAEEFYDIKKPVYMYFYLPPVGVRIAGLSNRSCRMWRKNIPNIIYKC